MDHRVTHRENCGTRKTIKGVVGGNENKKP
jgi:hypothetical protein